MTVPLVTAAVEKRHKYTGNDGSLASELRSRYIGRVGMGVFEIYPFEQEKRLSEIKKEKNIADDFPITRETAEVD